MIVLKMNLSSTWRGFILKIILKKNLKIFREKKYLCISMRETECTALPEMQGLHTISAALTYAKYIF